MVSCEENGGQFGLLMGREEMGGDGGGEERCGGRGAGSVLGRRWMGSDGGGWARMGSDGGGLLWMAM